MLHSPFKRVLLVGYEGGVGLAAFKQRIPYAGCRELGLKARGFEISIVSCKMSFFSDKQATS